MGPVENQLQISWQQVENKALVDLASLARRDSYDCLQSPRDRVEVLKLGPRRLDCLSFCGDGVHIRYMTVTSSPTSCILVRLLSLKRLRLEISECEAHMTLSLRIEPQRVLLYVAERYKTG